MFEVYKNDVILRQAIERDLEITGEAMKRILKEEPENPFYNARRIKGLRNQIIHGYDSVPDENIRGIVMIYLPGLKDDVKKLLAE